MTSESYKQFERHATLSERGSGIEAETFEPHVQKVLIQNIKRLHLEIKNETSELNKIKNRKGEEETAELISEKIASLGRDKLLLEEWLILGNIGLVGKVLKKYPDDENKFLKRTDLFQEGLIGLMEAVSDVGPKFKIEKGEFSTFAYSYIDHVIIRAIQEKGGNGIRYPVNFQEKLRAYEKAVAKFGTNISMDKLAKVMKITPKELSNFLEINKGLVRVIRFPDEPDEDREDRFDNAQLAPKKKRGYVGRWTERHAFDNLSLGQVLGTTYRTLDENERMVFNGWNDLFGDKKFAITFSEISRITGIPEVDVVRYRKSARSVFKEVLYKLGIKQENLLYKTSSRELISNL